MRYKDVKEKSLTYVWNTFQVSKVIKVIVLMFCLFTTFIGSGQEEGYYIIESAIDNKVLENAGEPKNGTGIIINSFNGALSQVFYLRKTSDAGYFTIESAYGRGIHVYGGNSSPKAKVTLWDIVDQNNLKWKFVKSNSGNYFHIQSKLGTYLDVQWGKSKPGTPVWMWSFNGGNAQKWRLKPFIDLKSPTINMTDFSPKKHGFNFSNSFKSTVGDAGSIKFTFNGLCGGVTYSANDYYISKKKIPQQNYQPAIGTPLYNYIYGRQQNSFASLIKYVELSGNPLGIRDNEFFYWGLEGRLFDLKRRIDKNKTIPLGLFNIHNSPSKHHQVLGIGYDLAGYKGNKEKDPNRNKVKIFIYDPNFPNKLSVLVSAPYHKSYYQFAGDVKNGKLVNVIKVNKRWRTYFLDTKYKSKNPPSITEINNGLKPNKIYNFLLEFRTGGDDLRGGNDNVHVHINLKNGKKITKHNANGKRRWPDHHTQFVEIALKSPISEQQIKDIQLQTTFGGGFSGDNWNLNFLKIYAIKGNGKREFIYQGGGRNKLLKRFTGDSQWFTVTPFPKK